MRTQTETYTLELVSIERFYWKNQHMFKFECIDDNGPINFCKTHESLMKKGIDLMEISYKKYKKATVVITFYNNGLYAKDIYAIVDEINIDGTEGILEKTPFCF
jgi:hypothetical protein